MQTAISNSMAVTKSSISVKCEKHVPSAVKLKLKRERGKKRKADRKEAGQEGSRAGKQEERRAGRKEAWGERRKEGRFFKILYDSLSALLWQEKDLRTVL